MRNPITVVKHFISTIGEKRSPHWSAFRDAWVRQHPTCAACGSVKDIQCHHKKPFHLFPMEELQPTNFISLCETIGVEHHLRIGHLGNFKNYNPNVEWDASELLEKKRNGL